MYQERENMAAENIHFVLVHGSCLGGWCWYKVMALLKSAGHTASAIDLGASGINPDQLSDIPTISGYLQPLIDFMAVLPSDEKVVIVGHSMGGVAISVAMEKFPQNIFVAIYVTAFMPDPTFNLLLLNQQYFTQLDFYGDSTFTFGNGTDKPPTAILFGPNFLATMLFQLSPPADLNLTLLLARPFPIYRDKVSQKQAALTEENYGSVHRAYIISGEDIVIPPATQNSIIQNYPPDEVRKISGSDHMVMISKPQELSSYLQEIAAKY